MQRGGSGRLFLLQTALTVAAPGAKVVRKTSGRRWHAFAGSAPGAQQDGFAEGQGEGGYKKKGSQGLPFFWPAGWLGQGAALLL